MNLLRSIKTYRKWLKIWGALPVRDWIRAATLYRLGNFSQAVTLYQRGIKRHPSHPANFCARIDLAYCLFRLGEINEAREILEYVTRHLPHSKEANLRLAELLIWIENYLEAALTAKRALAIHPFDPELTAAFLMAVLENGGPAHLLDEAITALQNCDFRRVSSPKLEVARATWWIFEGDLAKGKESLYDIIEQGAAPVEAYHKLAEVLIGEGKQSLAHRELRRALRLESGHPRTLALLAYGYLEPGESFNPQYAEQLATNAARNSAWLSMEAIYILAQAHFAQGDKMTALLIASRGREIGKRLGGYRHSEKLERFIETLADSTIS